MKRLMTLASLLLALAACTSAQPLSGSYTVGGNSPDFATPQDAANALKSRGVSGPVFINIRPGTYMRQGQAGVVMRMDTVVSGVSPVNRLTFQPDIQAGGNPSNVILQVDCDINTESNYEREVVFIGSDYTTLHNLTFKDVDSLDTPARFLVRVSSVVFANPTIEGLVVEGCTFIGTPYYTHGQQFGTDFGVYDVGALKIGAVRNCHFSNLMRAISFNIDANIAFTPPGDSLVIEDNRFDHLFRGTTGSGNPLGTAIEVLCDHPTVRANFINQSSGSIGLRAVYPVVGILEGNYVQGSFNNGQIVIEPPSGLPDRTESLMVRNNITLGSGAFHIRTGYTKLFHNTIVFSGPVGALEVIQPQCAVINNIILSYGGFLGYDQLGASGLISDHNVVFSLGANTHLVRVAGGQIFETLASYQSATGLDVNSHFTDVSFSTDSLGIHLDECDAQNTDLNGVPLPEVPVDFYGATRDSLKPFVGAVEGVRLPYNMFAAPFKSSLPGFALSLAEGKFDNSTTSGIAVPDWDNRQVLLYHNNGASRTFSHTGALFTGFRPVVVRFVDFDSDNNLDLIVGGDTNAVAVFWGNGTGGFSAPSVVTTSGRVRSLEPLFSSGRQSNTLWVTEDNGFLPSTSFLGNIRNLGSRQLCHDVTYRLEGISYVPDTIRSVMTALAVGVFDTSTQLVPYQVASLGFDFAERFLVHKPEEILLGTPCASGGRMGYSSSHIEYQFGTAPYLGFGSNIATGDFDGDGDMDFITTGADNNSCIFLKNQGSLSFAADTIGASGTRGLVAFDYENDGDLDFVTINATLDSLGVTVFLNNGAGHFTEKRNCYFPFASGTPNGVVAADFDLDGKKDIAVVSRSFGGTDSLFVLYNLGGFNGTTGVEHHPVGDTPESFTISQNYPNPFNPSTRIEYTLPSKSFVAIKIYNILGQEAASLGNEEQSVGRHVVEWNGRSTAGSSVSSGVYFYRVVVQSLDGTELFTSVRKMLLLK